MNEVKFDFEDELQFKILQLVIQDYTWACSVGLEIIESKYFDNVIYGKIFDWAKYLMEKYRTQVQKVTLKDCATKFYNENKITLDEKVIYDKIIEKCYEEIDEFVDNIEYTKERALEFAKREKFRQGIEKSIALLKMGPDAYEQAVPIMEKALSVGAGLNLGMDLKRDILNLPQILGRKYDKANMISCGLPSLDEAIGGGWIRGTLSLIGAAPGAGKSRTMAYFAASALKQGKKVAIVTLELDEDETLANCVSNLVDMTWWDMMDPSPEKRKKFIDEATKVRDQLDSNLKIKFYINKTISSQSITAWLMRLKSSEGFVPDFLVVDYMDLLLPKEKPKGRGEESNYDALGTVCFDLIEIAKTFNIALVSGTQLGRVSWDLKGAEVVSMASISESAKKAFNSHNLITINRNSGEKELGKARLYTAKARTGLQNKIVYTNYDLGTCAIEEVAEYDPTETVEGAVEVKQIGGGK